MEVIRQLKKHPVKLWRGYSALVARDLPVAALQFPALEYLKKTLIARKSRLKGG
jgi:solute carrier family 25 S-adenosylmethionine transporter 26